MKTDFDFVRLAALSNNHLFSTVILGADNNPATIERLHVLSKIEKQPGLHILQSGRQTGSTTTMVKQLLFNLECRSDKTYAIGTINRATSKHIVDIFRNFIITKLNPKEYDISARCIHNKMTNTRVYIRIGTPEAFRGFAFSGLYMDCFNFWKCNDQEQTLMNVLPTLYSLNAPCIIMNTGIDFTINTWYEEELLPNNDQYLFPTTLNDATIRSQANYINRVGMDAYRREHLCIR